MTASRATEGRPGIHRPKSEARGYGSRLSLRSAGMTAALTHYPPHMARQRAERFRRMRAAEVGRGGILTDLHDAAADRARAREMIEQRVAVAAPHRARELREVLAELREHLQHGVLVVQEHVAPHRRIGRRDAGEIAEAAGRELQHLGARHGGEFLRGADDRVGDQMRQVAGDRQHHVVMLGRHHLDVGAERAPERFELLDRRRIRALGRRQDAPAVDEQFGEP